MQHLRGGLKDRYTFTLMLLPLISILAILTIFPLIFSIYVSLHDWILYKPENIPFIGLGNYFFIFKNRGTLKAFGTTAYFSVLTVSIQILLGLMIALVLNRDFKGKQIVRSLLLAPMMTTPAVVGLVWRLMYNPDLGMINYYLNRVFSIGSFNWLGGKFALLSIVLVDIWEWTPFVALILMSALAALPKEPFEACIVDGVNSRQMFFYITLPLIRPALLIAILFRLIDSIRIFDLIYVLTQGGPGTITTTVSLNIYRYSFRFSKLGVGTAYSIILLIIVTVISQFLIKVLGREAK